MSGQPALIHATLTLLATLTCATPAQEPLSGADWELRALGVTDDAMLADIAASARARPVTLAIVGQGGVSQSLLEPLLANGTTLEYRMWPEGQPADPGTNTHDTQAAHVILSLTQRLGIKVRVLSYQPGESWDTVADAFVRAGAEADIVALYQSFWGDVTAMGDAIGAATGALFISPYVEVGERPTSTCLQSYAATPTGEGMAHFVTTIPAARSEPGRLLTPRAGPEDAECISFVAPSYYASSSGGTCPSAEVAAAVAAFIIAASPEKPTAPDIARLMRETSCVDRNALSTLPEFTDETLALLESEVARLHAPAEGEPKLAAPGLLSLARILERLREP